MLHVRRQIVPLLLAGLLVVLGLSLCTAQSEPTREPLTTETPSGEPEYEETFRKLYETFGARYPCFEMKGIDWEAVGMEFLPRAAGIQTDDEFGLLCMELVARLEDSHAALLPGSHQLPEVPGRRQWSAGIICLEDDRGKPVVYHVAPGSPADQAGIRPGMTLLSLDGDPPGVAQSREMAWLSRYGSISSYRLVRHLAFRRLALQLEEGAKVRAEFEGLDGLPWGCQLEATVRYGYDPRLPVPIPGIPDSGNVSWRMLDGDIGYIYVRRIKGDLIERLDKAVADLQKARGLVIDVRGNSGGGFDGGRALLNFDPDRTDIEPDRPRFLGPIAVLIDPRCISAGEGWSSWFQARDRARFFGEATAGASSAKETIVLANGYYKVRLPVRPRTGFLRRPIERQGIEPDERIFQNAEDLANGRDTVIGAACKWLDEQEAVQPAASRLDN